MDNILIKIGVIVIVIILFICIYMAIRRRKIVFVNDTKRKGTVDTQPSLTTSEKELPAKYTKKQFKKIEEKVNKVDDLEKKNYELEKKVKELSNQLEALRKDIKAIQEQGTKTAPSVSDNPLPVSSSIANKTKANNENSRPIAVTYERLTIGGDGNLINCEEGYPVYYRAWRERDRIKFEFVNSDRTKKAINNRSTFIEPFCNKTEESKFPDESDFIEAITPGILNDDYTVKEKALIRYK